MAENATDVTLRLPYSMIGTDETNVLQKLLLTARQVLNIFKAFANNLLKDVKLWKIRLSNLIQSGGFLVRFLELLLKVRLPLMKNALTPLTNSVLEPLGLTAMATANAGIHKKIFGSMSSGLRTTLIIYDRKMKDIIKVIRLSKTPTYL